MIGESKPRPEEGASGKREPSSLDKLADLTRRIIAVPKGEIPPHKPKRRTRKKKR